MSNKIFGKNSIKKLIKEYKYESNVVTYKCGEEDIEIVVNPAPGYEAWHTAITIATSIVVDGVEDEEGNIVTECRHSMSSMAYDCAVVLCFTNIDKSVNMDEIVNLVSYTDIADKIIDSIPFSVACKFQDDFNKALSFAEEGARYKNSIDAAGKSIVYFVNRIDMMMKIFENISQSDVLGENAKELEGLLKDLEK